MGLKHSPGCQDYLISRPDGSVIVGGAWKVVRPGPMDHWYNVTDDSKLIPAAEGYYNGFLERTFNEWRAVESRVSDIWTGIMGVSSRTGGTATRHTNLLLPTVHFGFHASCRALG